MSKKNKNGKLSKKDRIERERTGQQAFGAAPYGRYIQYGNPLNTLKLREIEELRSYPTVAYCMYILTIIGHSSKWTVEADEDVPWEAIHLVEKFVKDCKTELWRTGIDGWITHGYAVYEKLFRADLNEQGEYRIAIRRLKHLLPEYILINMDAQEGFVGVTVNMPQRVDLTPAQCLILTNEKQGDDLRGRPMLRAIKEGATGARVSLEGMLRYEEKLAKGPKYKVMYPYGVEEDENGNLIRNEDKARNFVSEIENNCFALMPRRKNINPAQNVANQSDYDLEMFPQDSITGNFINDLMYLDKLIVRAFGIPERAVLEGLFGTKADAENGTDFLTLRIEYLVELMVDQLNRYAVDPLMNFNYNGLAGRVKIRPGTIDKRDVKRISDLLSSVIQSPYGQAVLLPTFDMDSMMDMVEIPRLKQNETIGKTVEMNSQEGESPDVNDPPAPSWELLAQGNS